MIKRSYSRLADFHYELPAENIARYPLDQRSHSRLLGLNKQSSQIQHGLFPDLIDLLQPTDLLVLNNTRVIAACIFGTKLPVGRVEMLVERVLDSHRVLAFLRASKAPKFSTELIFNQIKFKVLGRQQELFELICLDTRPVLEII